MEPEQGPNPPSEEDSNEEVQEDASNDDGKGMQLLIQSLFGRHGQVQPWKSLFYGRNLSTKPKPFKDPQEVPWSLCLSSESLLKLLHGYTPSVMEDKWWIYSSGPDANAAAQVHFRRSWTGASVAQLNIAIERPKKTGGLWTGQVDRMIMEKQWSENDADEANDLQDFVKFQVAVVCHTVLGIDLIKPLPESKIWDELTRNAREGQPRSLGDGDSHRPSSPPPQQLYRAVSCSAETEEDMKPFQHPGGAFHSLPEGTTVSFTS